MQPEKDNPRLRELDFQEAHGVPPVAERAGEDSRIPKLLLAFAVLVCILQYLWFAPKFLNQIDFDGMSHVGIARHLREGEFHSAIHAFRSPLISWLIAGASFVTGDFLHAGKLVSIGSFLACLPLLYVFALRLWHSKTVAAVAVVLFTLGRGLFVGAVDVITPDFLFAAVVLVYFIVLLRCLRTDSLKGWFSLGVIHGVAFLAKAFALPWLAVCTVVAILLSNGPWRTRPVRLGLAAVVPLIVALGWATVLHSKYGVYTTGNQFKTNLLQWTLREYPRHREPTYVLLRDTTKELDQYMVQDPMPPGSWAWTYHVSLRRALPRLISTEEHNAPLVLKELAIVVTPGVLVGFVFVLAILSRKRHEYRVEWETTAVIAASAASLVVAYSMLAFDSRYLFPLIPLVLAVAARFLVADARMNHNGWRRISIALVVLGILVSLAYRSSPFRLFPRDFQVVSYRAGALLKARAAPSSVVSIGSGPFPESGVGWEAGYQAAYFGGGKLIGTTEVLPSSAEMGALMADLGKAAPEAILVWGRPRDSRYATLVGRLLSQYPRNPPEKINDPVLGEVGLLLFTGSRAESH